MRRSRCERLVRSRRLRCKHERIRIRTSQAAQEEVRTFRSTPEGAETLGASTAANDALEKDPAEWVSGDDPITPAQKSYLDTLARQAGEELPAD